MNLLKSLARKILKEEPENDKYHLKNKRAQQIPMQRKSHCVKDGFLIQQGV